MHARARGNHTSPRPHDHTTTRTTHTTRPHAPHDHTYHTHHTHNTTTRPHAPQPGDPTRLRAHDLTTTHTLNLFTSRSLRGHCHSCWSASMLSHCLLFPLSRFNEERSRVAEAMPLHTAKRAHSSYARANQHSLLTSDGMRLRALLSLPATFRWKLATVCVHMRRFGACVCVPVRCVRAIACE
eukprot:2561588-Pleurochrysis_carterae.AAC.2